MKVRKISGPNTARMGRAQGNCATNCGLSLHYLFRLRTSCATKDPLNPEIPPSKTTCHMVKASVTASTTAAKQAQKNPVINDVKTTVRISPRALLLAVAQTRVPSSGLIRLNIRRFAEACPSAV